MVKRAKHGLNCDCFDVSTHTTTKNYVDATECFCATSEKGRANFPYIILRRGGGRYR